VIDDLEPHDRPDADDERVSAPVPAAPVDGRPSGPPIDELASIGSRVGARLLDGLIIGVPLTALIFASSSVNSQRKVVNTPGWVQVLTLVVAAVYEVALIHLRGQTIGKQVLHIKVERITDGRLPDWSASMARYLVPVVPALIPIPFLFLLSPLAFLSAVWNPRRQGWHDRAAGTVVVRVPEPEAADRPEGDEA
jgi:uncharacterized RDD family membrane protein YckC